MVGAVGMVGTVGIDVAGAGAGPIGLSGGMGVEQAVINAVAAAILAKSAEAGLVRANCAVKICCLMILPGSGWVDAIWLFCPFSFLLTCRECRQLFFTAVRSCNSY